jgi:predicted nucleic acid-binding protein
MKEVSKEDEIKFETVKYIVNRYESHIDSIKKELVEEVKKLCKSNNVDSSEFEKALSNAFNNEIKF